MFVVTSATMLCERLLSGLFVARAEMAQWLRRRSP
jgi:hypothetical protein